MYGWVYFEGLMVMRILGFFVVAYSALRSFSASPKVCGVGAISDRVGLWDF